MRRIFVFVMVVLLLIAPTAIALHTTAQTPADVPWPAEPVRVQWQRTDLAVARGSSNHSWYWGPAPLAPPLLERDDTAPEGRRLVVYYDKGRMELPLQFAGARSSDPLTFGRLVSEMVSGNIQLGTQRFNAGPAAVIPVVGNLNDPLAPTYAAFTRVGGAVPLRSGARPDQLIDRTGTLTSRPDLAAAYPETVFNAYDEVTGHNVPRVFSAFMARRGVVDTPAGQRTEQLIDPLALIGRPISEAYWAEVQIGGQVRPVLVQLFERRVLSYTPSNPARFRVEFGNVGQHYYQWRYGPAQPRDDRREQVFDHFENGDQALNGGFWFSFDDRADGGTSTASNGIIGPGVGNSTSAMRFDYNATTAIPFSFSALAVSLGTVDGTVDLRNYSAIGFWVRGTPNRMQLRIGSAFTDDPFLTTFTVPAAWTYLELPLTDMLQEAGRRNINRVDAFAAATRLEFRPANRPSAGFIDIDNIVLINGKFEAAARPGLPFIDNFEDGTLLTEFGTEWFTYNDADIGGNSTAELAVVNPGANGSAAALRFRGTVDSGWADAPFVGMGVPLAGDGQTADLSEYKGIRITVRTDGNHYRLLFTSKLIDGNDQYGITLVAPNEWTPLYIPMELLTSSDPDNPIPLHLALTQVENIIITPLDRPAAYQLLIDDVELVR